MAITSESTSQQPVTPSRFNAPQTNPQNHNNTQNVSATTVQPQNPIEPIDFDECLKDSPKFRQTLKDNLAQVENMENCMTKTIKQVNNYVETGREHVKAQRDFINSMKSLNSSLGGRSQSVSKRMNTLLETLEEISRLHEIVIDQSARTVGNSLSIFINDDLSKLKEARKGFDKISHEYDQALTRYSQPQKKQQDDTDQTNLLIATSTAFSHTSLDLSIQLTALQSKKGYDMLDSLLSFTKAQGTFFHQGYDLFQDLKAHISDIDEFLSKIQDEFESLTRNLPSKHLMVSNNKLKPLTFDSKAQQVQLEGYLYKRASNGFKVWNRRWFILRDHQLLYQKRSETQPTTMEDDLRLLTVKPVDRADIDRRFCFEVLSAQKSHILQADSEAACKTWISAIQAGINAAFHDTELKGISKSPSTNEVSTPTTSSWGANFSFKALHQQATNKFISGSSEQNGSSKDLSIGGRANQLTKEKLCERTSNVTSGDDDHPYDMIDEQGRSYVQLRDHDNDDDDDDDGNQLENRFVNHETANGDTNTRYPTAASNQAQDCQGEAAAPPAKPQRAYQIILAMEGNDVCADCGAPQPKWASINLGITLCIECAGIHRSLGVHLSKVRSLTLDTEVWSPEIVQLMLSLGNRSVNSAYLACYKAEQSPPIDADSSRESRERFIKSKYLLKEFMKSA